jgi:hypothetical protein
MSSTISQNPTDIINGPRKRQPSKRVTENGDTRTNKKAKNSVATKNSLIDVSASNNSRRASVQDVPEPVVIPPSQPLRANRILEAADGSDDDSDDDNGMPGLEDVEDDDEDDDEDPDQDEAELCMISSFLNCQYTEINTRPPVEGMGRTYLCLLRTNPFY